MSGNLARISHSEGFSANFDAEDDETPNGRPNTMYERFIAQIHDTESGDLQWVSIDSVRSADSPRIDGIDTSHSEALAEVDGELPPILVQRSTMRVIDGMHRLLAARIRNQEKICVKFFDCGEEDVFILAVAANIKHGLPLTLADRRGAAARMIKLRPEASDRWVAELSGLSAKTVAAIRRDNPGSDAQLTHRIGLDGRVRPLNATAGRQLARELLLSNPEASLRKIARHAGISVGTARDVKEKIRLGIDPTLPKKTRSGSDNGRDAHLTAPIDYESILQRLRHDPSLRYTESGRVLLRWLTPQRVVNESDWQGVVDLIPPHRSFDIIKIARCCARAWCEFADELDRRGTEVADTPQAEINRDHA